MFNEGGRETHFPARRRTRQIYVNCAVTSRSVMHAVSRKRSRASNGPTRVTTALRRAFCCRTRRLSERETIDRRRLLSHRSARTCVTRRSQEGIVRQCNSLLVATRRNFTSLSPLFPARAGARLAVQSRPIRVPGEKRRLFSSKGDFARDSERERDGEIA